MNPENDAIREDVSDGADAADTTTTEGEGEKDRPKSPREIAMEEMEAKRAAELAAEGVKEEPVEKAEEKPEDKADDVDAQIEAQTEGQDEAPTDEKPAEKAAESVPQMVRVKVNGVEEMVPLDRVVAAYQKSDSAEKRLEAATRLLEEARAAHSVAKTTADKKEAAEAIANAQANVEGLKSEFFGAMFNGEQDKAKDALDKIIKESVETALKGREIATPDEAAIIAKVTPAVEQSLEQRSALKQFQKDFPKIATDPYLANRADAFLTEAIKAGKPLDAAFKEAGEKTLDWMRETLGVKSAVTVSTARTERAARKQEIDSIPQASAKTPAPKDETEQNVAATIAEMRKGRPGG